MRAAGPAERAAGRGPDQPPSGPSSLASAAAVALADPPAMLAAAPAHTSQAPFQEPTDPPALGEGQPGTSAPTLQQPSQQPSQPSQQPSQQPAQQPSQQPAQQPSQQPAQQPSQQPAQQPSQQPAQQPSQQPAPPALPDPSYAYGASNDFVELMQVNQCGDIQTSTTLIFSPPRTTMGPLTVQVAATYPVALCIAHDGTLLVPNHGNDSVFRDTDLASQLEGRNLFEDDTQTLLSRLTIMKPPDSAPLWSLHNPPT
jgi:hypothetical protein